MKRVYLIEIDLDEALLEKQLKEVDPSMQVRQTMYNSLEDYDYQRELDHYYAAG